MWEHMHSQRPEKVLVIYDSLSTLAGSLSEPGAYVVLFPLHSPGWKSASPSNPPVSTPLGVSVTSMCGMLGLVCEG